MSDGWAGGALAWLLVGCAVLLVPPRTGVQARRHQRVPVRRRPELGPALAGLSVAAACVAGLGLWAGPVVAGLAGPLTWRVLGRVRGRPAPAPADPALPLTLDLVAAALRGGRPLADALALAGPLARADVAATLARVAGLLRLGAAPEQAWDTAARDGPLAPAARVAVRSAESGIKVAAAFERAAAELRAERLAKGTVRAHRAGVLAMAPLAACFLPSFVCLGVVPVVVGIARSALVVLS